MDIDNGLYRQSRLNNNRYVYDTFIKNNPDECHADCINCASCERQRKKFVII